MAANLDRAETSLTAVSDVAYIRAIDSSGNSVRISKADLASVLGDSLRIKTINVNIPSGEDTFVTTGYEDEIIAMSIGSDVFAVFVRGLTTINILVDHFNQLSTTKDHSGTYNIYASGKNSLGFYIQNPRQYAQPIKITLIGVRRNTVQ